MAYFLFTDGGSRNNPGPAAIGIVLYKDSEILLNASEFIGIKTNNEAEYLALISGLKECIKLGIKKLTSHLDSELVVKQLNGLYKVKNENMKKYFSDVSKLRQSFDLLEFKHIKRDKNKLADKLVNEALDKNAKTT